MKSLSASALFAAAASILYRSNDVHIEQLETPATRDSVLFEEWSGGEEGEPTCRFWQPNESYTSNLCSTFSLTRLSATISERAIARAQACLSLHELDCVLAPEVGLNMPAAFVHREFEGVEMVTAPRILAQLGNRTRYRVHDPVSGAALLTLQLYDTVEVEFLSGGNRFPTVSTLSGTPAHCLQLLRHSFSQTCWKALE